MQDLYHLANTQRTAPVGTNGTKAYQAHLTGVRCLFLPMSAYSSVQNGFSIGSGFEVYFDDGADVLVNDRLVWLGQNYLVKGVERFTGIPTVSHVKVTAVTENAHV